MEYIRSFVAIELPEAVKAKLADWQQGLKGARYPFVKWVDPQGIHLTLKFLGSVAESQIPQIVQALNSAITGMPAFNLEIGGAGVFPDRRRPRVAWVGVAGDVDKLSQLQKRLDDALTPLGFPGEDRPFAPHLTVARLRDEALPVERQKFGEMVMSTPFEAAPGWEVRQVNLMRSKLQPTGAVYSCLARIELSKLSK